MVKQAGTSAGAKTGVTLLRGGWTAVWNGTQHQTIEGGEVAFQDGEILYAGPRFDGQADEIIDHPEWFVCPGFINLHAHIGVELMASLVDVPRAARFGPSREFVSTKPFVQPPTLTPEEQQLGGEFSLVQMVRCGATTIVDAHGYGTLWWLGNPPTDEELLAETVGRIGCRTYLGLGYRSSRVFKLPDGSRDRFWDDDEGFAGLEASLQFGERYDGAHDGRVRFILTPHAVDNCSPDLLARTLEAARSHGYPIEVHTAQYVHEVELVRGRYGDTPVGHLHNIGFLGPDIILGHCIFVNDHPDVGESTDRDLRLIAEAGSSVAHSPLPFARGGTAMHSLPRYLDHGINVGIGCDIWPADIIEEMRLAWFLGKHTNQTADRPTCMEVFTAATAGSADALGRSDLGRLTPGAKADIVCVDLSGYHFGPVLDPVRSLVVFGKGQDVDTIYVDGRKIVDSGHVVHADEEKLRAAAPGVLRSMAEAAAERDPNPATLEEILGMQG